jgi:hypothetical protein
MSTLMSHIFYETGLEHELIEAVDAGSVSAPPAAFLKEATKLTSSTARFDN